MNGFSRIAAALTVLVAAVTGISSAARAEATKVEIGYIPILASTPLFVIDHEGWAKPEGIDLKLTRFDSGPAAIQALVAGRVDAIYAGVGPVLIARASGADVSVIANSAVEELVLVARADLAALAKGKSGKEAIDAFAASKGRKVKISTQPPGSVPDTVLRYWLTKVAKVDPSKVELVSMGIEKTQQALLAGAVDAAMIREPTITIVRELDPSAVVLAQGGEMFPGQPGTVVAASGAFLKQKPQAAEALVKLHLRASEIIATDKARAAKASYEYIGKGLISPATNEKAIASPNSKFTADPHTIVGPVEVMQAFQKEQGSITQTPPVKEAFDFSFYDKAVGK